MNFYKDRRSLREHKQPQHPHFYKCDGVAFWYGQILPVFEVTPTSTRNVRFKCPRCRQWANHGHTEELGKLDHRQGNCSKGGVACWPDGILLLQKSREVKHNDY